MLPYTPLHRLLFTGPVDCMVTSGNISEEPTVIENSESVTEGEDKPLKYRSIFHTADAAIITKLDLTQAVEFDAAAAHRNIESVRPSIPVFECSAKNEVGMPDIFNWLTALMPSR